MATTEEITEKKQEADESTTNGDTSAPAPSVKAVKSDINDSYTFSDDEFPKTLTTLKTVKKPADTTGSDEVEICPIETEDDEFEEEPILLEVYNTDDENGDVDRSDDLQKAATNDQKAQFPNSKIGVKKAHNAKNKTNKIVDDDTVSTPIKPIPTPSAGTIEIPRELITSDASVISPVIINRIKSPLANNDDLIAILEGDDNGAVNLATSVEHYELSIADRKTNGEKKLNLTPEEEREIAMEQIMSLPKDKKSRPKLNQASKAARDAKLINKKPKNHALVNSLVSDWDENEAKYEDATETEIVVEIRPQKKQAIVEPVQPTFRRSRIIKKKIIWDPDAPETANNYASLAHTSGAGPIKKERRSISRKTETIEDSTIEEVGDVAEVAEVATPSAPKKKKPSEIDKLLGDEGAANMLNSLHQGNNNNNKTEGASPGKIPRAKPVKVEACNQNAALRAKSTKSKEVKEASPQKQQQNANKKNVAPKNAAAGKKRAQAPPKASSESWDFVYKSRPDDCMIIRRRSNSSYSSTASLNRTSIDVPNAPPIGDLDAAEIDEIEPPQPKRPRSNKDKNFEFAKPKAKKIGKSDGEAKYSFDEAKNSSFEVNNIFVNNKVIKNDSPDTIDLGALPVKLEKGSDKDVFTQISLNRFEHFSQINLNPDNSNPKTLLTIQVMKEIETALHTLEADKACKLVLVSSDSDRFCGGVDYSSLVQSMGEKRRAAAMELAKKLNNFVLALATYKKPLVALVQGDIVGFGARILPLFDVVWCEKSATFRARSQDLGEAIEGTALLTSIDKIDYNAKAKLLFLNEVMDAKEAKECNIVSQVLNKTQAKERVLIECDKLATKSILTLETFRLIQQQYLIPKLKDSLKTEQKQLLQQWTKSEFVDKLKAQL